MGLRVIGGDRGAPADIRARVAVLAGDAGSWVGYAVLMRRMIMPALVMHLATFIIWCRRKWLALERMPLSERQARDRSGATGA